MNTITAIQFKRAIALAAAHGHLWGAASSDPWEADSEEVAGMRRDLAAALAGDSVSLLQIERLTEAACGADNKFGGIYCPSVDEAGVVRHVTCTGRIEWAVARDGTTTITVTRPGPVTARYKRAYKDCCAIVWGEETSIAHTRPSSPELHGAWTKYSTLATGGHAHADVVELALQDLRSAAERLHEALTPLAAAVQGEPGVTVLRARVERAGGCVVERIGEIYARHVEALADCLRALGVDDATVLAEARRACPDAAEAADDAERLLADCEHGCDREQVARYAQLWRAAARTAQAHGRAA